MSKKRTNEQNDIHVLKVGDIVEFEENGAKIIDTVEYIGNGFVEGRKYDLTYRDFTKLVVCEELGI